MPKQSSRVVLTRRQPVSEFIVDFQLVDFRDWKSLTALTFVGNNDKLKETIELFFSSWNQYFQCQRLFRWEKHSFFISRSSNPSYSEIIFSRIRCRRKFSRKEYLFFYIYFLIWVCFWQWLGGRFEVFFISHSLGEGILWNINNSLCLLLYIRELKPLER